MTLLQNGIVLNKQKHPPFLTSESANVVNSNTLRTIYFPFLHSIINNGNISWYGTQSSGPNMLRKLQNRILKIINRSEFINRNNPLNLKQIFP